MNSHKSRAVLIIMACLLVVTKPDQGLDCRKLVFSRNCRGVAIKRGHPGNTETQSGIPLDSLRLNGIIRNMKPELEPSYSELGMSSRKNNEIREEGTENDGSNDKIFTDNLLYTLFADNKKRINKNENLPLYEYYNL